MSRPTSRRSPLGNVPIMARSSGRIVALGNGSGARNSIHPLAPWPPMAMPEIAGEPGRRRIGKQIHVVCKIAVGDALLKERDQPIAPRALVRAFQARILGHDGAIRPAAHIGGGGQIDVAENGRHDHAEGTDRDQRQAERR